MRLFAPPGVEMAHSDRQLSTASVDSVQNGRVKSPAFTARSESVAECTCNNSGNLRSVKIASNGRRFDDEIMKNYCRGHA